MTALVTARQLHKRYDSFVALASVDFEIQRGVTGLLGANGAGKTTILGMVLGLHPTDGGSLEVLGIDPWSAGSNVRTFLGYAPEHHTLPPDVPAADFVRHVAELHGLPRSEATTRASDALWLVGLGEERFRPMGTMSTGQRQRVKLAQAIAHDPQLVLLDEPTDGLDPLQRDNMLELIRSISDKYGIDVILSSHILEEVEQVCDGVVIIGDGKTIASGSLDELRSSRAAAGITIELDGDDTQVLSVASVLEKSFDVSVVGRSLTIAGPEDLIGPAARDTCLANHVGIIRLHPRRHTLEDVYLGQTG